MKLTDAQRALLIRAVEAGDDGARLRGAEHRSFYPLAKAGLLGPVSRFCGGAFAPATPAGRALVESWKCANCGHVEYHCPASGCNHYDAAPPDPFGDADPEEAATVDCDCMHFCPKVAS